MRRTVLPVLLGAIVAFAVVSSLVRFQAVFTFTAPSEMMGVKSETAEVAAGKAGDTFRNISYASLFFSLLAALLAYRVSGKVLDKKSLSSGISEA